MKISLHAGVHGPQDIERMAQILERTPGPCPVFLEVCDASGRRCRLKTGEQFRINPTTVAKGELEMILGPGRIEFFGQANGNGRNGH